MSHSNPQPLSVSRLEFLAQLPTLLNTSLDPQKVITVALQHLRSQLNSEAATVFLRVGDSNELAFWALQGEQSKQLEGKRISADVGIVGWVTTNKKPVLSNNVASDPRFSAALDSETKFQTKSMVCVPLQLKGEKNIGAIQVLNCKSGEFSLEDQLFIEQFAHQAALAIENARLYEDLRTRVHQLSVLDQRKQEMLTVLAHELRTPVNVIQGAAEMLGEEKLPPAERETISHTLTRGIARLLALVAKLRSAAVVTGQDIELATSEVKVSQLFERLAGALREPMSKRNIELKLSIENGVDSVLADPVLLFVATRNLLANAVRFTADGGEVSLSAKKQTGLVQFAVNDTGVGIASEQIPLIFEKFYAVGDALAHSSGDFAFQSGGLGLGLPATKAILALHQSTIEVDSVPGKGSEFRFSIRSSV